MKNLSEKAILVDLTISLWTATKYDKKVTKEVEEDHNATNAGRFNKKLIAKKGLEKLNSIANEARNFHRKYTLPWSDSGDRLLPALNYFEYVSKLRDFKQKFNDAVLTFIDTYTELKTEAKNTLGDMFNEKDYPSVSQLKDKFSIESSFMPIANLDDFRITVNQNEVDDLKAEIERNVYKRIDDATKDLWLRIKEAVEHMYEKLMDKDAIFRDSLVTNISDLIDLLPRLNFTNNPEISSVIDELKKLIVAPDYLRTNHGKRAETASNAKEILNKINDFVSIDIFQDDESQLAAA